MDFQVYMQHREQACDTWRVQRLGGPLLFTDGCSLASHVLQKVSQTRHIFKSLHKPWWPEQELHIDFPQVDHLRVELDGMNGVAWALMSR